MRARDLGISAVAAMIAPLLVPPSLLLASQTCSSPCVMLLRGWMRKYGVKRLIVQMGAFTKIDGELTLGQEEMRKAFTMATGEAGALAGNDEAAHLHFSECADVDLTITRPSMLTDGPAAGKHTPPPHTTAPSLSGSLNPKP